MKRDEFVKNNLNLTLSNIIHNQSEDILIEILGIQNFLLEKVEASEQLSSNIIYKYPRETIHHSLVNFLLPKESLINDLEINNYRKEHWDLIIKISSKTNELKRRMWDSKAIIKSIYMNDKSIALEAYLSENILEFSYELAKEIKSKSEFAVVKGFPSGKTVKFPINIVRFFRPLTEKEKRNFIEKKEEINRKLIEKPFEFEVKRLSLVISDDYLSNPKPEIAGFILK